VSLANRLEGLTEETILNCLVSGLNVDIKWDVVALSRPNLLRVIALAKLYEEKYMPNQKPIGHYPTKNKYSPFIGSSITTTSKILPKDTLSNTKTTLPPLLPTPLGPPLRSSNVKLISPTEMQLRRKKGLCYFYDEKFSFNHKCPNKKLFVLQLGDEDSDQTESKTKKEQEIELQTIDDHHLSLNALKGGLRVGIIKFMAYVGTLPLNL